MKKGKKNSPKQTKPLTPKVKPGGHSHLKLPSVLMHRPFLHGPDSHSSRSIDVKKVLILLSVMTSITVGTDVNNTLVLTAIFAWPRFTLI